MNLPKVLVGAPVCDLYEYCFNEFINNIKNLTYKNYDILLIDNSKEEDFFNKIKLLNINVIRIPYLDKMRERVVKSHNKLREYFLNNNYDYLLILDQDVIPQKEVIEKLINHKKDAVSALFFGHHNIQTGENKLMPFAWKFIEKSGFWGKTYYLNENEIFSNKLIEIAFAGMGCILLSKKVLKKIEFRYDQTIDSWDDRWLGYDIHKEGFNFYLDPNVKCKHLYLNRPFDYYEIKKQGLV
jgi:GT2 family glycosyltransferase